MASEWEQRPLNEISENFDTLRIPVKESERRAGRFPYYGASGIVDYVDSFLFDGDYLLVAEDGENLKSRKTPVAFMARGQFWVNNHAHVLRGNALSETEFLCYALQIADISSFLSGSTMPKLTQGNLARVKVFVPPRIEQRRIVGLLGALDRRISELESTNRTLEAIARTIFKSWFVDFDPVRAKAEGREPEGMDAATAALFPNDFEDSEVGRIPQGWKVGSIFAIANLLSGGTPKTDFSQYWGGVIDWASAKDVSQCRDSFLIASERRITQRGLAESSTKLIPAFSTVVVARGATTGRMVILGREMAMNQTCYALASTVGSPFTLYCLVQSFMSKLVHAAHGSVFETITTSTFSGTRPLLPPSRLLLSCESVIETLFKRILVNTEMSLALSGIRDTLLPRLISGKLRVPEAEKLVEAVL